MTTYRNSFEGGSNGVALSSSNMGGSSGDQPSLIFTSGTTAVFSTAQAAHGTLSALVTNSSTGAGYLQYLGLSTTALASRIYMRFTALPTADMFILRHFAATGSVCTLKFISTGALRIIDSAGATIASSPATPALNTWIRFGMFTDIANGTVRASYSTLDSAPTWDSGTLAANLTTGGATATRADLGKVTGVYATALYMDDLAVDDAATSLIAAGIPTGALAVTQTVIPSSGTVPFGVTATATATGGTGTLKNYSWDWGDGGTTAAQSSNVAAHTYTVASAPTYDCTVTVVNT